MTAKAFNITQFNGKYGCFSCLHPGESSGHFSWIYPYLTDEGEVRKEPLRDETIYLKQVEEATKRKSVFQGVKGECYFSKFISCPDQRLIDYMHCCILGTTKYTINLLVDSSKSSEQYYLGNSESKIEDLLKNIQYPSDYPRF